MNKELAFAINNRIQEDKLPVNYLWLQHNYNLSPIEAESCMNEFLNQNQLVTAEYLKCHIDNIKCFSVISLKPSSNTVLDVSNLLSENKRANVISCNDAHRIYKPKPLEEIPCIKKETITNVHTKTQKATKSFFPTQPIKKIESKPKPSVQKKVQPKSIKDSLKLLDSIIKSNTSKAIGITEEKADIIAEDVMDIENEPVPQITDDFEVIKLDVEEKTPKKRLNLFENFDDESPKQSKSKRRRLIIESEDDDSNDDKVLVNDSMIDDTAAWESPKKINGKSGSARKTTKTSKKTDNEETKKVCHKESKESIKGDAKKIGSEDGKKNILIDCTVKNKEDVKKVTEKDKKELSGCGGKKKIMRQVERTFKDDDGFLVTQKVLEPFSDDEDVENIVAKRPKVEHIVEKKSDVIHIPDKKPVVTKAPKKSAATKIDSKKGTQTNIMSFFKKKD